MGNDRDSNLKAMIDRIIKKTEEGDTSFIDTLRVFVQMREESGWHGWSQRHVTALRNFFRDLEEWADAGQPE